MNTYLVDEAVLGEFVDGLLKEKYPNEPVEKHADLKQGLVDKLDLQITKAIVGSLTEEQGEELSKLLDEDTSSPDTFENFFKKHNINLEGVIKDAMISFKDDFEKGDENE